MMRAATVLWAALATVACAGLFMLKYEVQAQEQRLAGLHKDIIEAEEQIHVLKAEWSYLNEPSRLREQAERHLGLHPIKPSQIVTIASLPMRDPQGPDVATGQPDLHAAPAVTVPQPPVVTRPAPNPLPPRQTPRDPARPALMPSSKPAHSMTADRAQPAPTTRTAAKTPTTKTAAGKMPSGKPAASAVAKAAPAPQSAVPAKAPAAPTYAAAPAKPADAGNVLVIKSPALADPEMASTRARP
jgi:hypothetical protein